MRKRWVGLATIGLGVALFSSGAVGANDPGDSFASAPLAIARAAADVGHQDDAVVVPAGTLDDGEELVSLATIGIDDAVAAAQTAASGEVGEIDLEYVDGTLVFNVDIGDQDVKVDASTGEVLSTDSDD